MARRRRDDDNTDHDYLATARDDADDEDDHVQANAAAAPDILEYPDDRPEENDSESNMDEVDPPDPPPSVSDDSVPSAPSINGEQAAGLDNEVINLATPSPAKKRKRFSLISPKKGTPKVKSSHGADDGDDEDDGLTCPICLDNWEMSGEHRLVSLRCGHLFGESCIKRWLNESARQSGIKACPQCKAKSSNKDIRCLYAKRIRAIDRSEEHRLREQLDEERQRRLALQTSVDTLQMSYTMVMNKIKKLESENERMKHMLHTGVGGGFSYDVDGSDPKALLRLKTYKLFLERNIEVARQPGCRVLLHAAQQSSLIATQKSMQTLFPGYGLRFIDTQTFRPTDFMFGSTKLLRDMCLSADQQSLGVASMETRMKLFDLRTRQVASQFAPSEKTIWACAMDRNDREHFLYLGAQHGSTYVYDIRFPETVVEEFKTEGDLSPVINIAPVSANKLFPNGGFLVCKLQSVWFYEYSSASGTAQPTRLAIEGPFISMDFDNAHETLLLSARSSTRFPQSRYIVGKLDKVDDMLVFNAKVSFFGSKATPVMTRCSQIAVEANTLVAGYIQDTKLLSLFDVRREHCVQTLPVHEVIYDTCPLYLPNATYLAALTETKCRVYKLTPTS